MFKNLLMTLFIIFGLAGLAIAFVFSFGMAYPEPEIEQVVYDQDDILIDHNDRQELKQKIETKQMEIANQKIQLEKQQELLEKMEYEIQQNIEEKLKGIRDQYQQQIDEKEKTFKGRLEAIVKQKEQEFKERLMVKKEFFQNKVREIIRKIEGNKIKELDMFKAGLNNKYYYKILNLRLKLKLLDLTTEEEKKYREELSQLKSRQTDKISNKEELIEKEITEEIKKLEDKYNKEYMVYANKLEEELNGEINNKKEQLEKELRNYRKEQQALLNKEIKVTHQKMSNRSQNELDNQRKMIEKLQKEYQQMQSDLASLNKEMGEK